MKKFSFFIMSILCSGIIANANPLTNFENSGYQISQPFPGCTVVQPKQTEKNGKSLFQYNLNKDIFTSTQRNNSTRADNITVYPEILNGISTLIAVKDENEVYFGKLNWDNGLYEMTLPEGVYQICGFGYTNDLSSAIVVIQNDVTITADSNIIVDGNDAVYSTDVKILGPSGNELLLDSDWGASDGNCSIADFYTFVHYKERNIGWGVITSDKKTFCRTKSNFKDGPFSLEVMETLISNEGICHAVIPVDFNKPEVNTDASLWQVAENTFTPSPFKIAFDDYSKNVEDREAYSMATYAIMINKKWYGTFGLGAFGEDYASQTGKICLWAPQDYNGFSQHIGFPTGAVINGDDSGVIGLPYMVGDTAPRLLGLNYSFTNNCIFTENSTEFESVFPYYVPTEAPLGNSAPVLSIVPFDIYFDFNFIGRHGEILNIDREDFSYVEPEVLEALGGPTNTVKVSFNGNLMSDNRGEFPFAIDWQQRGIYEIEVETNNILINDEVPGTTRGKLTFDSRKFNLTAPTVSAFQVVNSNTGEINDMISIPSEGFIRLFAGEFESLRNSVQYYCYYDVTGVQSVSVEYSPAGSGDYEALDVEEGALFITPGFGQEYNADLSSITRTSNGGWYDIRITVTDDNGSVQTQEICPALNISSMAGVEGIADDSDEAAQYYNLQGLRLDSPQQGSVVIERKGSKARKLIIR